MCWVRARERTKDSEGERERERERWKELKESAAKWRKNDHKERKVEKERLFKQMR